jgi:WD40 repeat protein
VQTGKLLLRLEGHTGAIRAVKFGPDDSLLSGTTDASLRWWHLPRQPHESVFTRTPFAIAVTPDGKYRFEAGGALPWVLEKRQSTNDEVIRRIPVDAQSIAVSSGAPLIVTDDEGQALDDKPTQAFGRLVVRDANSLAVVKKLNGPVGPYDQLAIGGDPEIVAESGGGANSSIRVWDAATGNRTTQ